LLETVAPLAIRPFECPGQDAKRHLMVLLPGIGDTMDDYEFHGFVEPVRRRAPAMDLVAVDAHYGYYAKRTVLERLRHDVIEPARARGYQAVWLVGISMGGFGALLYAANYPGEIAGVVALAPFLGEPWIIREIAAAGGLRQWTPGHITASDYPRQLWGWLKRYEHPSSDLPALYLAYGDRDAFAMGHRLLEAILPQERVLTTPGSHDWPTWKRLWDLFLTTRL
jgi:pimeloyl-ACP methyl ester carboxylesterase